MGLRCILLITVLAWGLNTQAQPPGYIDSLLRVFDSSRHDTDRVQALAQVASYSGRKDIAEKYLPVMRKLVEKLEGDREPFVRSIAEHARTRMLLWCGRSRVRATDYPGAVRFFDQVERLAQVANDTAVLALHAFEMGELYLILGDTANSTRFGYRAAELALAQRDSSWGLQILLGKSRVDTSTVNMWNALALADPFYGPDHPERPYYFWTRAWTLTAHGEHERAIADLLVADSLLAGVDDAFRSLIHWTLGEAYQRSGRSTEAIAALRTCVELADRNDLVLYHAGCARAIGDECIKLGNEAAAETAWQEAVAFARKGSSPEYELPALNSLKELYIRQGRPHEALAVTQEWIALRDSLARMDATKDLLRYEFRAEQRADSLLNVQRQEAAEYQLQRERTNRNLLLAAAAVAVVFGTISYRQRRRTQKALQRSDELLLNILPEEVADELKASGHADAKHFDNITVLFTDFKGFTAMSEVVTPRQLVHDLHECFSAFDRICEKHGIEKIKTIGDAYMAAGGLPTPNTTHAVDVIHAALEMRDFIAEGKARKVAAGLPYFEIRIGIHSGPVVAGIVGVKKFQYDIWGDTVNISEATYALVKDAKKVNGEWSMANGDGGGTAHSPVTDSHSPAYTFTPRGKVQAKGKGEMEMYFVHRSSEVA
jgi:class 3 adenylate cyclase